MPVLPAVLFYLKQVVIVFLKLIANWAYMIIF